MSVLSRVHERVGDGFIDRQGIIRHRLVVGPIETVPGAAALAAHCDEALPA